VTLSQVDISGSESPGLNHGWNTERHMCTKTHATRQHFNAIFHTLCSYSSLCLYSFFSRTICANLTFYHAHKSTNMCVTRCKCSIYCIYIYIEINSVTSSYILIIMTPPEVVKSPFFYFYEQMCPFLHQRWFCLHRQHGSCWSASTDTNDTLPA